MGRKSKPSPARYRTTNWSNYTASLRKRGSLLIWLDKEMTWLAPPDGGPGRPAVFSDAAIQFCLSIKVLFKLPLRQTTGMVASLLKLADLNWAVPDYTTLCRRQKTLAVQIPYRRADGPLNLLVDSTGIKFLGDGEWQARKHGVQGRRQWRLRPGSTRPKRHRLLLIIDQDSYKQHPTFLLESQMTAHQGKQLLHQSVPSISK